MNTRFAAACALIAALSVCSLPAQAHGGVRWSVTIGSPGYYVPPGVVMVPQTQYSYGAPPSVYSAPPPILPPPAVVYVQPQPVYVLPPPVFYQYNPPARLNVEPWQQHHRLGRQHDGWHDGRWGR